MKFISISFLAAFGRMGFGLRSFGGGRIRLDNFKVASAACFRINLMIFITQIG
jgi:hypothetical protein